jgi:hypothetical protein
MNWYKTSKLSNLAISPDANVFTACMYCKRWKTESNEWKKYKELDAEEKEEATIGLMDMENGKFDSKSGVSHTICAYCLPILKEIGGLPKNHDETNYIIEKSLAIT